MKKFFFIVTFILFLSACNSIKTVSYDIDFENQEMQKEKEAVLVTILQISDFHSNDFGEGEEKLLKKIQEADPDLILFTGDFFDFEISDEKILKNVKSLLEGIKEIPFFYVSGNHEFYRGHSDDYAFLIEDYGGQILNDKSLIFNLSKGSLVLAGVADPFFDLSPLERRTSGIDNQAAYKARLEKVSSESLALKEKVLKDKKTYLCSILLAHRPEYADFYDTLNFDLIFCGHAHGGQWRFPPLVNGLYAPGQGLFPKYAGGKYTLAKGHVEIVSRGLSYQNPRIPRIFNPPELVKVRLIFTGSR